MKAITWFLRVLSTATFACMCWLVYRALSGHWRWDAPYVFIVTVFRLLSFIFFFISIMMLVGFLMALTGSPPNDLVVGLYNTLTLRLWYMQPYHVSGPLVNIGEVFSAFMFSMNRLLVELWDTTFVFLYFLFAGVGVALFLQSMVRLQHKFVGGAFVSIQLILVVAAFRGLPGVPDFTVFPSDFVTFVTSSLQMFALVSFAYLEISFQMIYSDSVGKPVEEREEMLQKQLLLLRQATRKQDAIERGERLGTTPLGRSAGATAFSFLREAIERKVIGDKDVLENLDAISDVRRLQNYVDQVFASDPRAKDELTARAAAPSGAYVLSSTLVGSAFRFLAVISLSFLLMSPQFFVSVLNLSPGVQDSLALQQPEILLLFLVPIVFLFPFLAVLISAVSGREELITEERRRERRAREAELEQMRKEAEERRKERERARRERIRHEGTDEWDEALRSTYDYDRSG